MNYFRKDKFNVFGKRLIKNSFEEYHNSASYGVITVADKKYQLETSFRDLSVLGKDEEYSGNRYQYNVPYNLRNYFPNNVPQASLILIVYSVIDPMTYEFVRKSWNFSLMKHCNPNTPVILLGCNADQREKTEESKKHGEEMGLELARRIKATKFLECSGYDVTDLESINQNLVRVSARNKMRPLQIVVLGSDDSKKSEMIKNFVHGKRLNTLGQLLNEEPRYRGKYKNCFSTLIEIDGDEYDLMIVDEHKKYHFKHFLHEDFVSSLYGKLCSPWAFIDVVVFSFSVVNPATFHVNKTRFLDKLKHQSLRNHSYNSFPPIIILVGTETDLRNDPETLNNLLKQEEQPLTYEMGEQLARDIKAVKYLECSSFDGTKIKMVFEEVVWASLRRFEEERKTLIQKEKGFFQRLFERLH